MSRQEEERGASRYCRYDKKLAYSLNFAYVLSWYALDIALDLKQAPEVCRMCRDYGRTAICLVLAVARERTRDEEANDPYRCERDEEKKDVAVPPVAACADEQPVPHGETLNRRDETRDGHNEHIPVLEV